MEIGVVGKHDLLGFNENEENFVEMYAERDMIVGNM